MKEAGFTLVETLFALVAGGLLLVGLGWAVSGLEDRLRRTATITAAEQVDAITPFLTTTLGHAYPPARGAVLAGTADQLGVLVPPPDAFGPIGPVRLLLAVGTAPDGARLSATFAPDTAAQHLPTAALRPTLLARGFKDIRFGYLRRPTDRPDRLPRLITLLFTAKDGTPLPVGIEPRLAMGADCLFDPISLACRP